MIARLKGKRLRYAVATAAALFILYAVCGFWLAPMLVKRMLPQIMANRLNLTAAVKQVYINPFAFSVRLNGFSAKLPGSPSLVSFAELYVNVNPWSVIGTSYHIQEVNLQGLSGHIIRQADGRFNFESLLPRPSSPQTPSDRQLPSVSVDRLQINNGRLQLTDLSRKAPFDTQLDPIRLEVTEFSTRHDAENGFALKATLARRATIDAKGRISLTPPESSGRILVSGLPLKTGWEYIREWVRFEITEGSADLNLPYTASLQEDGLDVSVNGASFSLADLKVVEKEGGPAPILVIPSLAIRGLSADLKQKKLRAEGITSQGSWVKGWLTPEGKIGLASVLALEPFEGSKKALADLRETGAAVEQEWHVAVDRVLLADSAVDYEDRTLSSPFHLRLEPIRIELKQLSNRRNDPAELNMTVEDPAGGIVSVSGSTVIHPASADLTIRVDGIALTQFEPYLSEIDNITIKSGTLHSEGGVRFSAEPTADAPQLRFSGRLGIKDLAAADAAGNRDFFRFKGLEISGFEFQSRPNRLNIADIAIKQPSTDVVIMPDGRINVTEILKSKPGSKEKIARSMLGRIANAIRLQIQGPVPFKVDRIALADGTAGITDQSIEPGVSLQLQPYDLSVTGLDSVDPAPANADLAGSLGSGADLKASGRFNPFMKEQPAEMNVSLDNFDLTGISPYAGRYAGYTIDRGQLSLGLDYTITQQRVDGANHIRLIQLTLGKRTDSPDAIDLPLPLAVALLKNRKGDINLNLPIQGNLDDPQFQIGDVITRTLINLISSVVTSPFSALGSLTGAFSAEELKFVGFKPGSDQLEGNETEALNTLAEALKDRPALILQIQGIADSGKDRNGLARQRLSDRIKAMPSKEMKAAGISPPGHPEDIAPGSQAYQRALIALFQQQFNGGLPDGFDPNDAAAISAIEEKLLDTFAIEEKDLLKLARRRAERIKSFLLLEGKIAADRLLTKEGRIIEPVSGDRVNSELGVSI